MDKYIDEERPNVLLASASPVGLNFASQSLFDLPSSQFSSYHDNDDATHNQNDAQIQGECLDRLLVYVMLSELILFINVLDNLLMKIVTTKKHT